MAILILGATCSLGEAVVDKLLSMDIDVIAAEDSHYKRNSTLLEYSTANLYSEGDGYSISFDGSDAELCFIQGIETLNFEEIPAGTTLARISEDVVAPLLVLDEDGKDITNDLFVIDDGQLINKVSLMPSMLTRDEKVIRQDCLCYVMERYLIGMGEKYTSDEKPVWTV